MEKEQKRKLYKMGLPIIMGTILLLGVSYAWLTLTLNGTKTNVLKAGTLSLTLTDAATNGINMQGVVPMLDEVGVTTSPYSFTLKNNGTIDSEYTIYLDDVALSTGETKLPDNVIKYNLVKDGTSQATALLSTIGSNPNRVLDSGVIKPNETYNYDLRLWLDQNATIEIAGQIFKGKIRVVAEQIKETAIKEPEPTPEQCFDFDESTGSITLYKCGTKIFNGSSMVDATSELLPEGINEPILDVVIPNTINGVTVTQLTNSTGGFGVFYVRGTGMGITSVVIPDSVINIGMYTFSSNQLTSVAIPNGVKTMGIHAFSYNQLTSVTIPKSVTSIGFNAFSSNQLTSIVIPTSVTSIDHSAFEHNQLTSVIIPNSVISIGAEAFNNNQLPDSEAFIYKRNADGTEDKTTIVSYGGAKRDNVQIPEGVTSIVNGAFISNQLTSVTIPSSVTSIETNAFSSNQLTSVTIKGKSSSSGFSTYGTNIWGWASGYSDANITWNG